MSPSKIITSLEEKAQSLKKQLSSGATIIFAGDDDFKTAAERWTAWEGPKSGAVVRVATEADVQTTIAWAIQNGVKFLAQAGSHGFQSGWGLTENDIVINLRALNSVDIDLPGGNAILGGGTIVREAVNEAYKQNAMIVTGTCNQVGVVGAILGGGVGRQQGKHGLGIDNMISARVVIASGEHITVSEAENSDLWYGLRGAGHNFGIVTSLTVKAYPAVNNNVHWSVLLIFPPPMIEAVGEVISNLQMDENMAMNGLMLCPPPTFQPTFGVPIYYMGTEEEGRAAYASLLALGPVAEIGGMTPLNMLNDGTDAISQPGGLKPTYSASVSKIAPASLREIWESWLALRTEVPDAAPSMVMLEKYSIVAVDKVNDEETAFPERNCDIHVLAIGHYNDVKSYEKVSKWGKSVQASVRRGANMDAEHQYVNFAIGDEPLEVIYGGEERLAKLRALKKKWDPEGQFNSFHGIV